MRTLWKIWTAAKTEDKALRVSKRVQAALGREIVDQGIEPYAKTGGFLVCFSVELESEVWNWNDAVAEVIELGQRVGHEWILSGDVRSDLSGWSNRPSMPGITSIEWILFPERTPTIVGFPAS
jgi:hypothetical protein